MIPSSVYQSQGFCGYGFGQLHMEETCAIVEYSLLLVTVNGYGREHSISPI